VGHHLRHHSLVNPSHLIGGLYEHSTNHHPCILLYGFHVRAYDLCPSEKRERLVGMKHWVVALEVRYVPLPPEKRLQFLSGLRMLFACKPSSPPAQDESKPVPHGAGATNPPEPPYLLSKGQPAATGLAPQTTGNKTG
jgi:hypothetical protein